LDVSSPPTSSCEGDDKRVIRVLSSTPELSAPARADLAAADADFTVIDDPATPLVGDPAVVTDVVHVPSGAALDRALARQLAQHSPAGRLGILADDAGLVVHRGSSAVVQRYHADFAPPDDREVYVAGGRARAARGAGTGDCPPPRQLYLGLTQHCNRSCTFCVSRQFDYDLLSLQEVERICDESGGEVDVVALTGAGEAMTHPHFWDALDLLCERIPGVRFKMNTSGVALGRKADRLLDYPIKNITVSLNAATRPTYEKFVGKGFQVVLDGIAALVGARVRRGRDDLDLCLSMVLMNSTVGETAQLATIAAELGVEQIQGIYLMINDDELAAESPWHQPQRSNRLLDDAERHSRALGVRAALPPRFALAPAEAGSDQLTSLPETQGRRCTEAWSTVYVRPNGEIMACPYMDHPMGSLRESTLNQIWTGDTYRDLRACLVSGRYWPECASCCGFNESGGVDEYSSHWLGARGPRVGDATRPLLPLTVV
jgi:radical SAM protein with 4Fe4S-binding SPASM domain